MKAIASKSTKIEYSLMQKLVIDYPYLKQSQYNITNTPMPLWEVFSKLYRRSWLSHQSSLAKILIFQKQWGFHRGICVIILWCKIFKYFDKSRRFQLKRQFTKLGVINEGICVKEYKKLSYFSSFLGKQFF